MSHWHTFQPPTALSNVAALRAACEELGLELIGTAHGEKPVARGYSSHTRQADYVIKLKGRYDVACDLQPDKSLALTTDWWQGDVAREVGKNYSKLVGLYQLHVAQQKAKLMGLATQRRVVGGKPQLMVLGR